MLGGITFLPFAMALTLPPISCTTGLNERSLRSRSDVNLRVFSLSTQIIWRVDVKKKKSLNHSAVLQQYKCNPELLGLRVRWASLTWKLKMSWHDSSSEGFHNIFYYLWQGLCAAPLLSLCSSSSTEWIDVEMRGNLFIRRWRSWSHWLYPRCCCASPCSCVMMLPFVGLFVATQQFCAKARKQNNFANDKSCGLSPTLETVLGDRNYFCLIFFFSFAENNG